MLTNCNMYVCHFLCVYVIANSDFCQKILNFSKETYRHEIENQFPCKKKVTNKKKLFVKKKETNFDVKL